MGLVADGVAIFLPVVVLLLEVVPRSEIGLNALEYRRAGYDIYTFGSAEIRDWYRGVLATTGAEYDLKDVEEVVAHTELFFLAVKRVDPTFKQRIIEREKKSANFPKGD